MTKLPGASIPSVIIPDLSDVHKQFLNILQNQPSMAIKGEWPSRQHAFLVTVDGSRDLKPLRDLCLDPNNLGFPCLTAYYRSVGKDILGTLLVALLRDLRAVSHGVSSQALGEIAPPPEGRLGSVLNKTTDDTLDVLQSLFDENLDVMAEDDLSKWIDWLSKTIQEADIYLYVFAETYTDAPDLLRQQDILLRLLSSLPEQVGFVFSGLPESFSPSIDAPHFQRLYQAETPLQQLVYRPSPLQSDRPARQDQLGIDRYAQAMARLILHRQTAPLTIGLHGQWGMGKSTFMELLDKWLVEEVRLRTSTGPLEQYILPRTVSGFEQTRQATEPLESPPITSPRKLEVLSRLYHALARLRKSSSDLLETYHRIDERVRVLGLKLELTFEEQKELARLLKRRQGVEARLRKASYSQIILARFNAWTFEDAKQIWAGLCSEISRALENSLNRWDRFRMHLGYNWRRFSTDFWLGFFLPVLISLILTFAVLRLNQRLVPAVQVAATPSAQITPTPQLTPVLTASPAESGEQKSPVPLINDLNQLGIPLSATLVVLLETWFIVWRYAKIVQPASQRILGYAQMPSYRDQMGFQHQVKHDIEFVHNWVRRRRPNCKVVVFIDDLDRCEEDKVVDVLQATNLILGASDFYVVMGLDTEMIYRAIRVHYAKYREVAPLPEQFPEQYLRKIIQLPFNLPAAQVPALKSYMGTLFSPAARLPVGTASMPTPQPMPPGETLSGGLAVDLESLRSPAVDLPRAHVEREVEDTPQELRAFQDYLSTIEENPRAIKRLVNVHRLVKIILQMDRPDIEWSEDAQRKLVKWLVVCTYWPDLRDDFLRLAQDNPTSLDVIEILKQTHLTEPSLTHLWNLRQIDDKDVVLSSDDLILFRRAAEVSQMTGMQIP